MRRRSSVLASAAVALLALCGAQAAVVRADPAERIGPTPPKAVPDPTFGGDGLITLPGGTLDSAAYGAAAPNGDVIVSGGPNLRLLTSSGAPAPSFGGAGTLSPPPAEGSEFELADFTVDSQGRLLVVGTSRFPADEGSELRIEQAAVRILRFLSDGSLDSSFGQAGVVETDFGLPPPGDGRGQALQPETSVEATGIAVDPRGRIVVTGAAIRRLEMSCAIDGIPEVPVSAAFLARLTENGALDPSFGGDGLVGGRRLDELPLHAEAIAEPVLDRKGRVTYRSTSVGTCATEPGRWGVAQLTPDGRARKRLGKNGGVGGYFTALAGAPDGSVVALAAMRWNGREAFRARLVRISPNGTIDRSFGRRGNTVVKLGTSWGNEPNSLALDARGRILLAGTLATGKRRSILLVRLSADGRQERSFGPNGRVTVHFQSLLSFGPSDLWLDPRGRAVTVHRHHNDEAHGLVLARFLLRG